MADNKEFQRQAERINSLVKSVNELRDATARTTALELLQEVMSLHASVLDRMLDIASKAGDPGLALIEKYTQDPLISGLLVLYDLHPENLEVRLARALDSVRPSLQSQGADVELIEFRDGVVNLRLTKKSNGCASSTANLKTAVEQAIYEAAPEVAAIVTEGASPQAASGFVPLAKLQGAA